MKAWIILYGLRWSSELTRSKLSKKTGASGLFFLFFIAPSPLPELNKLPILNNLLGNISFLDNKSALLHGQSLSLQKPVWFLFITAFLQTKLECCARNWPYFYTFPTREGDINVELNKFKNQFLPCATCISLPRFILLKEGVFCGLTRECCFPIGEGEVKEESKDIFKNKCMDGS